WSYADRSREISVPGYYSVPLTRYGITAELTATERVGFHRYTFPASEEAAIVFDLVNGGCWDKATDTHIEAVDADGNAVLAGGSASAIRGWRFSTGWADDQKLYFYAEFSKPFDSMESVPGYSRFCFSTSEGENILVKVALSPVSMDGARANMAAELSGWDFDAAVKAADNAWNEELGKVRIETSDDVDRKIFYTALYHTMIAPSVFNDADGSYRGSDARNYPDGGFTNYTTFSLWDTYRAAMPLFSIIHPEKENDIINTMLHIYSQQGKLPVWHLMGCETDCMVGNPGIPPVADAILKGYDGFDYKLAYEALKVSAMRPDRGQDLRMKYGYIPCDLFNESVAYDMEYALADWAVAQVAAKFAAEETDPELKAAYESDYAYFIERSRSYRNFFDPETGFMRGKTSKGAFRVPFSPFASEHRADDYCEGNAWQYTWLAPHDFDGLVECFGSKEALLVKLDSLFTVSSVIEGGASPDISGLIGQYAHGNEPSHHILYFYTIAGQPWKTAEKVREVLNTMYHAAPDGLSGNEDVGQMSAWYVLSSLGFYQVEPAGGRYWFGSPLFDKAEIKVAGGTFKVIADNNSDQNIYIKSVKLNGKPYDRQYIDFRDITAGGELVFEMSSEAE
ncbi:MAG: GH92 family glycosyl hydrolase, partial [Bacteroidales bacterium]|nr:GH92 family glycosyl hydrolase [Bacteroidales bacterium]